MARIAATLILALLTCSAAGAAESPGDALRQIFAQADQILTDPETAERPLERLLAVRKLVNEAFDFRGAAELASGDHWLARTAAEQEEFTWLFADLLERGFVWRMASRASLDRGTKIRYVAEFVEGDAALVQTAMARRDGGELLLDYYLVDREGTWKVRDVAIDGVSLMANYRAQLDRVLGTASFPELLSQMRAKVGAAEPGPTAWVAVGSPTMLANAEPTAETADSAVSAPAATDAAEPAPSPPPAIDTAGSAPPAPAEAPPEAEDAPLAVETVSIVDVPLPVPEVRFAVFDPPVHTLPALTIVHAVTDAPPAVRVVHAVTDASPAPEPRLAVPEPGPSEPSLEPPPRPRITKAYWLQILTAGTADEAGRIVSRLREGKFSIGVERTMFRGRLIVHVRVGPFPDAEQAILSLLDLQARGHDPVLFAERE